MRRLGSLIALCAWFAAQTPFMPCPAAVLTDRGAAGGVPAAAGEARQQQHHHAGPATAEAGAAALAVREPPPHGGTCTMLTRCEWVAVPTPRVVSEPVRDLASTIVTGYGRVPSTAEPFSSTPPPRPLV